MSTEEDQAGRTRLWTPEGEPVPASELLPLVYEDLRALARSQLGGRDATLQATSLVHEAWLRVVGDGDPGWECRAHFFGAAARAMRNILVDRARRRDRLRHGGGLRRVPLTGIEVAALGEEEGLVELDEALARLEQADPRAAEVVSLRYFAGLTIGEAAGVLSRSRAGVERDWAWARAWLHKELSEALDSGGAVDPGLSPPGEPERTG